MPCDCPNTVASNVLGHLWVRCRAEGCPSIWYRPRHQPEEQALAEADSVVSWPGAWRGKVSMAADFDELPADIEAAFLGDTGRDFS
jgi:hypothetical protein